MKNTRTLIPGPTPKTSKTYLWQVAPNLSMLTTYMTQTKMFKTFAQLQWLAYKIESLVHKGTRIISLIFDWKLEQIWPATHTNRCLDSHIPILLGKSRFKNTEKGIRSNVLNDGKLFVKYSLEIILLFNLVNSNTYLLAVLVHFRFHAYVNCMCWGKNCEASSL